MLFSGVTVSCFLLSYIVVFAMEGTRLLTKLPGRLLLMVGMLIAGLFAHSIFLVNQFAARSTESGTQVVANWFQWSVLGAWGVALVYLVLTLRNPKRSFGLFLIPMILVLIGLGLLLRDSAPFNSQTTINIWNIIHGVSQLVGTMVISLGLAFGVMYLVQSHRLKTKKRASRIKLPTLEFLQKMNRNSLLITSISLGIGVVSGIILNVSQGGLIAWFSSGIVFSCMLFGWALLATLMDITTKGTLGGRRSAQLVIANFFFLVFVLGLLLFSSHGFGQKESSSAARILDLQEVRV